MVTCTKHVYIHTHTHTHTHANIYTLLENYLSLSTSVKSVFLHRLSCVIDVIKTHASFYIDCLTVLECRGSKTGLKRYPSQNSDHSTSVVLIIDVECPEFYIGLGRETSQNGTHGKTFYIGCFNNRCRMLNFFFLFVPEWQ